MLFFLLNQNLLVYNPTISFSEIQRISCRYVLRRDLADPEDSWASGMIIGKNPKVRHAEDRVALEAGEHSETVEEANEPVGEWGAWFGGGSVGYIVSVDWGTGRVGEEFTVSPCALSFRRSDILLMPSHSFWSLISVCCW